MEITTRLKAISQKQNRYFTGKECRHGHIAERYTKSGICLECAHPKFENISTFSRDRQRKRHLAASMGFSRYSPGSACKRGHICERYVSTDACIECLRPPIDANIKSTVKLAKATMQLWGFKIHEDDLQAFTSLVYLYVRARCPVLALKDVISKRRPEGLPSLGFLTYFFYIFVDDSDLLRAAEADFMRVRRPPAPIPCGHTYAEAPDLGAGRLRCTKCGEGNYIAPPPEPRKARS